MAEPTCTRDLFVDCIDRAIRIQTSTDHQMERELCGFTLAKEKPLGHGTLGSVEDMVRDWKADSPVGELYPLRVAAPARLLGLFDWRNLSAAKTNGVLSLHPNLAMGP